MASSTPSITPGSVLEGNCLLYFGVFQGITGYKFKFVPSAKGATVDSDLCYLKLSNLDEYPKNNKVVGVYHAKTDVLLGQMQEEFNASFQALLECCDGGLMEGDTRNPCAPFTIVVNTREFGHQGYYYNIFIFGSRHAGEAA
jgi:hypothetical protein